MKKKTTYMHTEADQKKHYVHKKSAIYFASSIRTNIWYVSTLTNKYCKTGVGERRLQWSWFVKACIAGNVFFCIRKHSFVGKNLELIHSWETCFGALVHLSCFLYIFMQMFWRHWLSIFCNFKHFNFLKHYEIN